MFVLRKQRVQRPNKSWDSLQTCTMDYTDSSEDGQKHYTPSQVAVYVDKNF